MTTTDPKASATKAMAIAIVETISAECRRAGSQDAEVIFNGLLNAVSSIAQQADDRTAVASALRALALHLEVGGGGLGVLS